MAGAQPTLTQLRAVLRLALETAMAPGARGLPAPVRNLVRSRRLPADWGVTMRRALEHDDAFRDRVGAAATEEQLERLPWLWLTRPEGWQTEIETLVSEAAAVDADDRGDHDVAIRLAGLERDLAQVRADARADAAEARAAVADARADAAQARADARDALDRSNADVRLLQRSLADLKAALGDVERRVERLIDEVTAARAREGAARAEVDTLRAEYHQLRDAARDLAEGIVEPAFESTGWTTQPRAGGRHRLSGPSPADARHGQAAAQPVRRPRGSVGSGRLPVRLPPAIFEESAEAAAHLVKVPEAHLVVDGYNVVLTSWSGSDLAGLRDRLIDALAELAVRIRRYVTVVFDGAEAVGSVTPPPSGRPWLRVVFSSADREADEVIVDTVRRLPVDVPVVVVTDDREVRDQVGALGANVLSVAQILSVAGRRRDRSH